MLWKGHTSDYDVADIKREGSSSDYAVSEIRWEMSFFPSVCTRKQSETYISVLSVKTEASTCTSWNKKRKTSQCKELSKQLWNNHQNQLYWPVTKTDNNENQGI